MRNQGLFATGSAIVKIVAIACSLPACTVIHLGPDASRRVVGLADVQVSSAGKSSGLTGNVVTVRAVGLTLNTVHTNPELAIGYYEGILGLLRDFGPSSASKQLPLYTRQGSAVIERGYAIERELPANGKGFLGLVDVTVLRTNAATPHVGVLGNSKLFGLGFAQQPQGIELIVGYSRSMLLTIERNAVVILGRIGND